MEMLIKEIEFTQAAIARYDQNGMMIKNWCITTWGAATVYGFEHNNLLIIGLVPYMVLCFFVVEWVYRVYQLRFIRHSAQLQKMARQKDFADYQFGLSSAASSYLKGDRMHVLKQPHFVMLYIMLIIGSVIAFFLKW